MAVVTYDPTQTTVVLGGQLLTGYAPGTFIAAHFRDNAFRTILGSEGEVTRTMSLDRTGLVTVTLLKTSYSNAVLEAYANADRAGGLGIFDVLVKDVTGGVQAHGARAWIIKPEGFDESEHVGSRTWHIAVENLEIESRANAGLEGLISLVQTAAQNLYRWAKPFL